MSLLESVSPENATGIVAQVYGEASEMMGFVPNALQKDSINPDFLQNHWNYIKTVVNHPSLSGELMASIRLLMSEPQDCQYCIDFNTAMLVNNLGMSLDQVKAMRANPADAPLNEKERALLVFTVQACADSNNVEAAQIQTLRDVGATDREIFDALSQGAQQISGDILINALKIEAD